MADKPLQPRRRTMSDPAAAAQIQPADVDEAVAQWRRDAPPALRDLLDAQPKKEE